MADCWLDCGVGHFVGVGKEWDDMIRCVECGNIFSEDKIIVVNNYGIQELCPRCRSTELEEIRKCQSCGTWISEENMDGCGLCSKCADMTLKAISQFILLHFNKAQLNFLREHVDDRVLK